MLRFTIWSSEESSSLKSFVLRV